MSRASLVVGALLVALGLGVFGLKLFAFEIPLAVSEGVGPWQVELRVNVRGSGARGSVRALLPASENGQAVFDENPTGDRLEFTVREQDGGNRTGVWAGEIGPIHEVVYAFHVQMSAVETPLPASGPFPEPPQGIAALTLAPSRAIPADAPEVAARLERLELPGMKDLPGRIRTIYQWVANEVASVERASDDPLLVLANEEGSETGKELLLTTLMRGAGVPARIVHGLELRADATPRERTWTEVWIADRWVPMSASPDGFFARRPENFLVLGRGNVAHVEATSVISVGHRYRSLREHLRADEIANLLTPDNPIFERLSFYRLPLPTQAALRVLLLIPLGAVVIAIFRNVIGVQTYGTFMPILISLALREFALWKSLALVVGVIAFALVLRRGLEFLRLLMVPRLSIMLCTVVLVVAGFALVGDDTQTASLFAGVLFPMVILTMLTERIFITSAEEGVREAVVRAAYSTAVAAAIHPIFQSARAEYLMFTFPELTFCAMGVLVWIGGYTGYRVTDLLRFRRLAEERGVEAA
jgi:transglutaminase-like putative cysteine protease